jgi:hypothetical protein
MLAHGRFVHNLLVDGMLRATWWIEREGRRRATLAIRPHGELSGGDRDEVAQEAALVVDLVAGDAASRDVRFEAAVG